MKFIWRVESEEGVGMYQGGLFQMITDTLSEPAHPGPFEDKALGYYELHSPDAWYFGFASIEQMLKWIHKPAWRTALKEEGFRLVKYRVPDSFYRQSESQAIFMLSMAEPLEKLDVDFMDAEVVG